MRVWRANIIHGLTKVAITLLLQHIDVLVYNVLNLASRTLIHTFDGQQIERLHLLNLFLSIAHIIVIVSIIVLYHANH